MIEIALLVIARVTATTWSNVVQKRLLNPQGHTPLALFTAVWGWMTLLTIPWWLQSFQLSWNFWMWLAITCALEVPGNVVLLRSLRSTELSIFGPLSSVKPAISLALAFLLFREIPGWLGIAGVVVVLIGSAILTSEPSRDRHATVTREQRRRGIQDRLLAVLLTAIASVFLKKAMESANAWQVLSAWCMLCWVIAFAWQLVYSLHHWQQNSPQKLAGQAADYLPDASLPAATTTRPPHWLRATYATYQRDKAAIFMVAVGMLVMQGCTIGLFARMPVGYALALFQAGSLVSVIVGHKLLGEGHVVRRLAAATIMVIGATMIIFAG